jgi:hypothetical protein
MGANDVTVDRTVSVGVPQRLGVKAQAYRLANCFDQPSVVTQGYQAGKTFEDIVRDLCDAGMKFFLSHRFDRGTPTSQTINDVGEIKLFDIAVGRGAKIAPMLAPGGAGSPKPGISTSGTGLDPNASSNPATISLPVVQPDTDAALASSGRFSTQGQIDWLTFYNSRYAIYGGVAAVVDFVELFNEPGGFTYTWISGRTSCLIYNDSNTGLASRQQLQVRDRQELHDRAGFAVGIRDAEGRDRRVRGRRRHEAGAVGRRHRRGRGCAGDGPRRLRRHDRPVAHRERQRPGDGQAVAYHDDTPVLELVASRPGPGLDQQHLLPADERQPGADRDQGRPEVRAARDPRHDRGRGAHRPGRRDGDHRGMVRLPRQPLRQPARPGLRRVGRLFRQPAPGALRRLHDLLARPRRRPRRLQLQPLRPLGAEHRNAALRKADNASNPNAGPTYSSYQADGYPFPADLPLAMLGNRLIRTLRIYTWIEVLAPMLDCDELVQVTVTTPGTTPSPSAGNGVAKVQAIAGRKGANTLRILVVVPDLASNFTHRINFGEAAAGTATVKRLPAYNASGYVPLDDPLDTTTVAVGSTYLDVTWSAAARQKGGFIYIDIPVADDSGAPQPVTGLAATAGDTQVALSWTNPGGTWDTVTIVRKPSSPPASVNDGTLIYNSTGQSLTDVALTNGTTYYYAAFVVHGASVSAATRVSATPEQPAPPPIPVAQLVEDWSAFDTLLWQKVEAGGWTVGVSGGALVIAGGGTANYGEAKRLNRYTLTDSEIRFDRPASLGESGDYVWFQIHPNGGEFPFFGMMAVLGTSLQPFYYDASNVYHHSGADDDAWDATAMAHCWVRHDSGTGLVYLEYASSIVAAGSRTLLKSWTAATLGDITNVQVRVGRFGNAASAGGAVLDSINYVGSPPPPPPPPPPDGHRLPVAQGGRLRSAGSSTLRSVNHPAGGSGGGFG